MNQKERVLNYIKEHGSIPRLEAFTELGIFELSSNIVGLEKQGYEFTKVVKTGRNRFNKPFHFTIYFLKG